MYKKMPPATDTLRDSNSPAIGMHTRSHSWRDFSDRPLPSLPKTKHNGRWANESATSWESWRTGFISLEVSGWPASIFILSSLLSASRWNQLPHTIGSWKEAPRLARIAFSLNGSQQPGSRKMPPCWTSNLDLRLLNEKQIKQKNSPFYSLFQKISVIHRWNRILDQMSIWNRREHTWQWRKRVENQKQK